MIHSDTLNIYIIWIFNTSILWSPFTVFSIILFRR